ncbi:MAG: hypothetical protein ACERJ1_08910 [Halodesulfovibrio sp.]|uniref:hypothetical protein n=1 Tax=Halodesulfovibrio sp. TaxID=1912772 RepID=UPI00359E954D
MSERKMPLLREAAQVLGKDGRIFSNKMLYLALHASGKNEQDRIRRRANKLVETGEFVRVSRGQYSYNARAAPAENAAVVTRMWRTLKTSKPGFTVQELARVSGAGYSYALKYLRALEEGGYVRRCGQQKQTALYQITNKVREQHHAFQPPSLFIDPFQKEKACLHELVGLFMQHDLHQPRIKEQVAEQCKTILNRFEEQNADVC